MKHGIRLLPGGKGVFPHMTVRENLEMGAYIYRGDTADRDRRIARVLDLFPALADRQDAAGRRRCRAASSRCWRWPSRCCTTPTCCSSTSCRSACRRSSWRNSSGSSSSSKRDGMTIVIVEQSLNVALAIADRAVFLEKGRVRFEGPAEELRERDDLARAVFLGTEGG